LYDIFPLVGLVHGVAEQVGSSLHEFVDLVLRDPYVGLNFAVYSFDLVLLLVGGIVVSMSADD